MTWIYICIFTDLFVLISIVTGDPRLTSDVGLSARDCRLACINRVLCQAFTFSRQSTFCQLYVSVLDEFTAGMEVPGLVYMERKDIPEDDPLVHCNSSCSVDSTCESGCLKSECQSPSEESDIVMIGNVRRTGSKAKVACKNFFQQPIMARCTEAGVWYPARLACEVYNYDYHGPNTYGGMMPGGHDIRILSMESDYLEQCLATCNETANCGGVNFNPDTRNCTFRNVVGPRGRVEPGWNYYSKTMPITHHSLNNKAYEFTYDEGVRYCETLGTSIATQADVILAHSLGYHMCACCWVEEGYSVIPLQKDCSDIRKGVRMCWFGIAIKADLFCKK